MMRLVTTLVGVLLFTIVCSGCHSQQEIKGVEFKLDQSVFALQPWQADNSHITTVHGKVLVNKDPVVHALIQYKNQTVKTNKDGMFSIQIDKSKIQKIQIQIKSLKQAVVSGDSPGKKAKEKLLSAKRKITVVYPIEITKVTSSTQNPNQVQVYGKAITPTQLPVFTIRKYAIYGVVRDYNGKPVKDARVAIKREGGEGYFLSRPSNSKGKYTMYYLPDADEETRMSVTVGNKTYFLPKHKVFYFPKGTSIQVNIQLPKKGTVVTDKPPYLVSRTAPGAVYNGILIGLDVSAKVNYKITIPKKDGSFILTLPKKVWEGHPGFYETKPTIFLKKELSPGAEVDRSFIPSPQFSDPDHILAKRAS